MKISTKHRAISPVLATVILIAITLVAGVAIAGFAFGLFGSLGNTAQLSIRSTSCIAAGCSFTVQNTGTVTGNVIGASSIFPANSTAWSVSVGANSQTTFFLDATLTSGHTISGYLVQSNGPTLSFTATVG